jgi:hypothetical protein
MSVPAGIRVSMAVLTLGLALSETQAQYALDANLSVHGTRNVQRAPLAVGREIYSVNRATGTMVYNRASAFNDSAYSIHQRSAFTLFDSPHTSGVSTAADIARAPIPEAAPPTQITSASTPPHTNPFAVTSTAPGRVAVSPVNQFVTPVSRGPIMQSPTPVPARAPAALTGPAYSVPSRPLRTPGAESSRVRTYSVFGG